MRGQRKTTECTGGRQDKDPREGEIESMEEQEDGESKGARGRRQSVREYRMQERRRVSE
jgi:hypothetical protein